MSKREREMREISKRNTIAPRENNASLWQREAEEKKISVKSKRNISNGGII